MTNLRDQIDTIDQRIRQIEERFSELGYNTKTFVQTEIKTKWKVPAQAESLPYLHTAIVIETIDPWKMGRVRFFSPHMHDPQMTVKQMPWAYPIANFGGFDDCGSSWIPPAGSKLCILFEKGNRQWPFYIGTTWDRDRGPDGNHKWNYPVEEYYKIHEGHRKGYMVGKNDGSQVFMPWNTETYNGYDIDSLAQFENDPEAKKKITYPHIYGMKTPQKSMLKFHDGNYKCNFRGAKTELKSGQGNILLFKDDHLHPPGITINPQCCASGGDTSVCNDEKGNPLEKNSCPPDGNVSPGCSNPYHKHTSECLPYRGPGTPQNNKIDEKTLPQSGWQIWGRSGNTIFGDDSVEQPRGVPRWERGAEPFDFGCTDLYKGRIKIVSAMGQVIEMSDKEKRTKLRGDESFIRLKTPSGISCELNDDSADCECAGGTDRAGPKRGFWVETSSRNVFQMSDENNEQCGPCRAEGGVPTAKATNAFIKARTGYGLEIHMGDDNHQEKTQKQYIQITAPQKDACCGPHIIRLQEDPNCGQIFIRAGGDYVLMTEGDHYTVVGAGNQEDEDVDFCEGGCLGPRNKIVMVSQHSVHYSCNFYFNVAEIHAFLAERIILLMAGKDCKDPNNPECGPCVWPVVVMQSLPGENGKGISRLVASDRVFASASLKAPCCHIYQLLPFTTCGGPSCEEQGGSSA